LGNIITFGDGEVKSMVKNVLNYKKPIFWMTIIALVLVIILGIDPLTNQKKEKSTGNSESDKEIEVNTNNENSQNYITLEGTNNVEQEKSDNGIEHTDSSKADNMIIKYGTHGVKEVEYELITEYELKRLDLIIFDYMIRSAAWPGIDVTTMEEYYYIKKGTSEYYVFMLDGTPCMQLTPNGSYSVITEESYILL